MSAFATLICLLLVLYLFACERREHPDASAALWLPVAWMFLAGSRYVSAWLNLGTPVGGGSYDEGSPMDAASFGLLIISGIMVLARRDLRWSHMAAANKLVLLYFVYCLASVLWSDAPLIGVKRWFKELGNPVMALIILTDRRPGEAFGVVLRRFAYLALPASVLFVRYLPELGRGYHMGEPMFTGIGNQKNALGQMCLISGLYLTWQWIVDHETYAAWPRARRWRLIVLGAIAIYLLDLSDSQTSIVSLLLAAAVFLCARLPKIWLRPARLLTLLALAAVLAIGLESSIGIRDELLEAIGRDPSLTNRTDLWGILIPFATDPLLGAGFMSFWSGDRLEQIWAAVGATVIQAHNGYLELYLNLGYVGVGLLGLAIVNGLHSSRRSEPRQAVLRIALICSALAYNYTEASFYGINNMWTLLVFALINVPAGQAVRRPVHHADHLAASPRSAT